MRCIDIFIVFIVTFTAIKKLHRKLSYVHFVKIFLQLGQNMQAFIHLTINNGSDLTDSC